MDKTSVSAELLKFRPRYTIEAKKFFHAMNFRSQPNFDTESFAA